MNKIIKILSQLNMIFFIILFLESSLLTYLDYNHKLYYKLGILFVFMVFYILILSGIALFLLIFKKNIQNNIINYILIFILILQNIYYIFLIFAEFKHLVDNVT